MEFSSNGDGFFQSADELLSAIESELGPEAAEALRRSRERRLQPRELTGAECAELRTALEPVLRDLRATGAIVPDVREQAWDDDPDFVFAWVESDSSGLGIRLDLSLPAAERVAELADQVQEWEVEELAAEGRPATWPECPEHPDSHPLAPGAHDNRAVWSCPRSGHVIQPIGALGLPARPATALPFPQRQGLAALSRLGATAGTAAPPGRQPPRRSLRSLIRFGPSDGAGAGRDPRVVLPGSTTWRHRFR